jgi:hypothetical protein
MTEDHLSQLQFLAETTDEALLGWTLGRLLLELELLRDKDKAVYTQLKVPANELRATQRLIRLAMKHEDREVATALAEDALYLEDVIAQYQVRWDQCETQGRRLWKVIEHYGDAVGGQTLAFHVQTVPDPDIQR